MHISKKSCTFATNLKSIEFDAIKNASGTSLYGDCTALVAADWIGYHNLPTIILTRELDHYIVAYGYGGISNEQGGEIERKKQCYMRYKNKFIYIAILIGALVSCAPNRGVDKHVCTFIQTMDTLLVEVPIGVPHDNKSNEERHDYDDIRYNLLKLDGDSIIEGDGEQIVIVGNGYVYNENIIRIQNFAEYEKFTVRVERLTNHDKVRILHADGDDIHQATWRKQNQNRDTLQYPYLDIETIDSLMNEHGVVLPIEKDTIIVSFKRW